MADRATLHRNKLVAFAEWAEGQGYEREKTRGEYEVLRLRKAPAPPLIFFVRHGGDHVTFQDPAHRLVWRFIRESAAGDGKRFRVVPAGARGGKSKLAKRLLAQRPMDWADGDLCLGRWYAVPGNPGGQTSSGAWPCRRAGSCPSASSWESR